MSGLSIADSVKSAAKAIANDMLTFYHGDKPGQVPGNLPEPYYWWETGAMFGSLIDYAYYTQDNSFNPLVTSGMLFQVGDNADYMPPNQTKTEGNDDQCFWALAAMSAAETNFPNPPANHPQWLALAQAVYNTQVARWEEATCGGGLRWQIFTFNKGYNYKNSISNGCFFNLAARLARYTGNDTYAQWADKTWNWMESIGLVDDKFYVYDGADTLEGCQTVNKVQFTYNAGAMLLGAANMYNYTNGGSAWRERTDGLLSGTDVFFPRDNVMVEVACENRGHCNLEMFSFKAYLSRWMAATTKMAPWTYDRVMAKLRPSAEAAAKQCSGGNSGRMCGQKWTMGASWDGSVGVGQQMAALEVVQSNLITRVSEPFTGDTGGTSIGDASAGTQGIDRHIPGNDKVRGSASGLVVSLPGAGDRFGAWFLTLLSVVSLGGLSCWICSDDWSEVKKLFSAILFKVAQREW